MFRRANDQALGALESYCAAWLPQGRREGGEWVSCCFAHAERTPSLKVNLRRGVWKCFGCGVGGGDPVALLSAVRGIKQSEAAREILGEPDDPPYQGERTPPRKAPPAPPPPAREDQWETLAAAPDGVQRPDMVHPYHGQPAAVWEYRRADGSLAGLVGRYDKADGRKEISPRSWCQQRDGSAHGWRWRAMAVPRPLYRSAEIAQCAPDGVVVVVEGEKAADALQAAVGSACLVTTWSGGCKALGKTDFSLLYGRKVILWPDADKPGRSAMESIASELLARGCGVGVVPIPTDATKGWDAADAVAEGLPVAEMLAEVEFRHDGDPPPPPDRPVDPRRIGDLPFRMLGMAHGIYYYLADNGGQVVAATAAGHGKTLLFQLAAIEDWQAEFGGAHWDSAVSTVLQAQQQLPIFDPRLIRGRGCWIDDGQVVFHAGDRIYRIPAEGEFAATALRDWRGGAVYPAALRVRVDRVDAAADTEAEWLRTACTNLAWEDPLAGKLLAGWLALAPVCGALLWRPHIWITGPAGCGKSWVIANIVAPLMGCAALHVQGATTEAGIRGMLGQDAFPVVFDEHESSDERSRLRAENVLELARQASSETGAAIVKGTASGGSVTYRVRSMFCFSSIGVAAVKKADTSRISVLNLQVSRDAARFRELASLAQDIGTVAGKLRSRSLRGADRLRQNAQVLSDAVAAKLGDKRLGDQMGTLLAGWVSLGRGQVAAVLGGDEAAEIVGALDWRRWNADESQRDEWQCWNHLLAAKVRIDGGGNVRMVQELIDDSLRSLGDFGTDDAAPVLLRHGLALDRETGRLMVANQHGGLDFIYEGTPWQGGKWREMLARLPDAERERPRRFGPLLVQRCVSVPVSARRATEQENAAERLAD